ncbi:MAG: HAD-IIB family hydrolase [Rhodobacteraceae bacterium]|nr:HAD-IIB family hydrolase [Paracoccaceae bacterium]
MQPIASMPPETARSVRFAFCDIDDTLTTAGRLPGAAYQALEDLDRAGIAVVPVTGRPAGWCDMIARVWPVAGVVGENGAFYYAYDRQARRMIRSFHPDVAPYISDSNRFDRIIDRIRAEVPGAALSADQSFRIADLAVDFCEDVPRLADQDIARIKQIFMEEGAIAKISSIHVNGWFGNYDKLSMTRQFAMERLQIRIDERNAECIFVGDSPNDAPMFTFFANACGVANVCDFADQMTVTPKWVAQSAGGSGFREIVSHLLEAHEKG